MESTSHPRAWKVLLAFAIIYFVWGSTFLAIRVGVREVPPFLLAGMRFLVAGAVLYAGMRIKGTSSPRARGRPSATVVAGLLCGLGPHAQAAAAGGKGDEFRSTDAGGRNPADHHGRITGRVPRIPRAGCVVEGMAGAGLPDRRGIHYRVHCVRVADSS